MNKEGSGEKLFALEFWRFTCSCVVVIGGVGLAAAVPLTFIAVRSRRRAGEGDRRRGGRSKRGHGKRGGDGRGGRCCRCNVCMEREKDKRQRQRQKRFSIFMPDFLHSYKERSIKKDV